MEAEREYVSAQDLFAVVEEMLAGDRQALFTVTGMSMWPFICHGRDKVVLKQPDQDQLKKGDIILFQTPGGKYLLHRIVKITDREFITAGDGNLFLDGVFPRDCVRGVVVKIIRKGREIDCGRLRWKLVFAVWMSLFPVRKWLLKMLRWIARRR